MYYYSESEWLRHSYFLPSEPGRRSFCLLLLLSTPISNLFYIRMLDVDVSECLTYLIVYIFICLELY